MAGCKFHSIYLESCMMCNLSMIATLRQQQEEYATAKLDEIKDKDRLINKQKVELDSLTLKVLELTKPVEEIVVEEITNKCDKASLSECFKCLGGKIWNTISIKSGTI